MRFLLLASVFLFFDILLLKGQPSEVDSLEQLLTHIQGDTNKVIVLNELADIYHSKQTDSSLHYSSLALSLSKSLNYQRGIAESCKNQGSAYFFNKQFSEAIDNFQRILSMYQKWNDQKGLAWVYRALGVTYRKLGNDELALTNYHKGIEVNKNMGNRFRVGELYHNVAAIYMGLNQFVPALEAFQEGLLMHELAENDSLSKDEHRQNLKSKSWVCSGIGGIYQMQQQYDEAMTYYHKVLEIGKAINDKFVLATAYNDLGGIAQSQEEYDQAIDFYEKFVAVFKESGNVHAELVGAHNLGTVYYLKKEYKQSLAYFQKSISMEGDTPSSETLVGLGRVYIALNQPRKGLEYTRRGYQQAIPEKRYELLKVTAEALSKGYEMTNRLDSALFYAHKSRVFSDSAINTEQTKKLTLLEAKYAYNKEKAALELAHQKDQLLKDQKLQQSQYITYGAIVGIMVILSFATLVYRNYLRKQKDNQLLQEKNDQISHQAEELHSINEQLKELDRFKQQMMALIVHDLKNPLNVIIGNTETKEKAAQKQPNNSANGLSNVGPSNEYFGCTTF